MKQDWDVKTSFTDSVGTNTKTVTFPKTQESVKVANQGNVNLTYTIGSKTGTLTPGQSITVNENINSFTIVSTSNDQSFEVLAFEAGTEKDEEGVVVPSDIAAELQQVKSDLADKAKQTDLNTTNANLDLKADKTELQAVASGSPKGTYATVTDLQAAFPTGNSNIYVVTADGGWYYWNGSAWTKGGTYQGTGVANKSITAMKLTDEASRAFNIDKSIFGYNCAKIINPAFVIGSMNATGVEVVLGTKVRSDYFSATSDFTIKLLDSSYRFSLYLYDANKTFISYATYSADTFVANTSAFYRIIVYKSVQETVTDIDSYANTIVITSGTNVINQGINDNKSQTLRANKRLDYFGVQDVIVPNYSIGSLSGTTGGEADQPQKVRTDYFQPSKDFTITLLDDSFTIILFTYDGNKTFLNNSTSIGSGSIKITITSGYYYRFVISKDVLETVTDVNVYANAVQLTMGNSTAKPSIGKSILFLGDSITAQANGWVSVFSNIVKPSTVVNVAVPGATWCDKIGTVYDGNPVSNGADNNVNNVMGNQVQKVLNNNYATPDYIIIAAGTNDNTDTSAIEDQFTSGGAYTSLSSVDRKTFAGAMRYAVETLLNKYPNAQIFICTPIQSAEAIRAYANTNSKATTIKSVANRLSLPIFDAFTESGIYGAYEVANANGKYLHDGLHPSTTLETSAIAGSKNGATKLGTYFANKFISTVVS